MGGVGFFETLRREQNHFSIKALDLKYPEVLYTKLDMLDKYYYRISNNSQISLKNDIQEFKDACQWIVDCENTVIVTGPEFESKLIYEGSQGLLLDQDIGFFPHCTPSNVGSKYFVDNNIETEYFLVTRAYQTRHGNGPMTIHGDFKPLNNPNETNASDGYQGKFRKSMLDLDLISYGIRKDGGFNNKNSTIVITCLEHMPKFVFWYKDREMEFTTKEEFCQAITKKLGFSKYVMCENHNFSDIQSI